MDRKKEGIYREAKKFITDSESEKFTLSEKIKMLQSAINNYKRILGFWEGIDTEIELAEKKKQQLQKMQEEEREQQKRIEVQRRKIDLIIGVVGGLIGFAVICMLSSM